MDSKKLKLKIAFQGGGANLISLLECAAYLSKLEKDNKIEILEVSGTSAGSIVAGLIAMGIDLEVSKIKIKNQRKKLIKSLKLPKVSKYVKLLSGKPLLNINILHSFLEEIFIDDKHNTPTFNDIKIPLTVIVTDLKTKRKSVFDKIGSGKLSIVDAIASSCALPLVFRTHKSESKFVDGGLCENLPIEELKKEKGVYNLAVGFIDTSTNIDNLSKDTQSYIGSLFSASIRAGVLRSELSASCDDIIKLHASVDLLDFEGAFDLLDNTETKDLVCKLTDEAISRLSDKEEQENLKEISQSEEKSALEKQRRKAYKALASMEHDSINWIERTLSVTPYCLFPKHEYNCSSLDSIHQIERFIPEKPLRGFHMELATGVDQIREYRMEVIDLTGNDKISVEAIEVERAIKSLENVNSIITLFLFFDKDLKPDHEYEVRVNYHIKEAFKFLEDRGRDHMTICNGRNSTVKYDRVSILLFCPKHMADKISLIHLEAEYFPLKDYKIVTGKQMSDLKAESYVKNCRDDFKTVPLGWEYEGSQGLAFKEACGVDFIYNNE
jgi:predicted acylesterase/phospholipase RssA